jgi:hypothetical protein
MSGTFDIQRRIWGDESLSANAKTVALCLAWHMGPNAGFCRPSVRPMSRETGLSKRAV